MKVVSMDDMFYMVLIVALLAAFVVLFLGKIGVFAFVQVNGNDFFSRLAKCEFCLSFWFGLFIAGIFCLVFWDWRFLLIPFLSTPITRFLI